MDDVNGTIIGGSFVGWTLFYDNRPQSGKHYADTDQLAIAAAKAEIARLVAENAPIGLYRHPQLWEIRLT